MGELVCVRDFEKYAHGVLSKKALDYYKSGAGQETSLLNNRNAFTRLRIRPRFLTNVSKRDASVTVLGTKISMPVGVSPTAMQRMAHPEGECANARAAQFHGTVFILSTIATSSIEEIGEAAPNGINWFQLYIYTDRVGWEKNHGIHHKKKKENMTGKYGDWLADATRGPPKGTKLMIRAPLFKIQLANAVYQGWKILARDIFVAEHQEVTKKLVKRAENAGFRALVLTVDTPMFGLRLADIRNKFTLPPHLRLANFEGEKATKINKTHEGSGLNNYVDKLFDTSLTWDDVKWLKSITRLPIVLKGILTAEDATIAADLGIAAILVSNHGARQVDGVPASIEALPEIANAVGSKVELYLDGGVTDGTDVFKALALGAKMVFMGRPTLWGLAYNGEEGVKKILDIIKKEFDFALALTGCSTPHDIKKAMVVHENYYARL